MRTKFIGLVSVCLIAGPAFGHAHLAGVDTPDDLQGPPVAQSAARAAYPEPGDTVKINTVN